MKTDWRQWRPSWQSDFHVCSFLEARHVTGRVWLSRKAHFTVRRGDYCVASFITLTGFLQIQGFVTFDVKCSQPALQAERRLTDEYECATWLSMHMYVKLDEAGIETDLQYHLYTAFFFSSVCGPTCFQLWLRYILSRSRAKLLTLQFLGFILVFFSIQSFPREESKSVLDTCKHWRIHINPNPLQAQTSYVYFFGVSEPTA